MENSIGIFDSGLGGLTVLRTLAKEFPNESFCYLGDIARLPYGNKSPETIRKYGLQIIDFLVKKKVKAIIIACNSASSVFLDDQEISGVPILNVIVPGSEAALRIALDKKIGILGTSATIKSHAYQNTIKKFSPDAEVLEKACPLFVPLVEEGFVNDEITELVAKKYLAEFLEKKIKTIVLGCTHYPLLKGDLEKVLGQDVKLIESGSVLSERISQMFQGGKLSPSTDKKRQIKVYITDLTDHFERLAGEFMAPEKIDSLERVVL